jgi:acyl-CoA thioesterase I
MQISLAEKLSMQRHRKLIGSSALFMFCSLGALAQTPLATTAPPTLSKQTSALTPEQKKLIDWPNLARYHDADRQVAPPIPGESRVVFFGDSITDSWNLSTFFPGKPYLNRGISGQTTPQMLVRFRADVIDLKPALVVILAGTNDIAGNT